MTNRTRLIVMFPLILIASTLARAQWIDLGIPAGPKITGVCVTSDSGVFVSRGDTLLYYVTATTASHMPSSAPKSISGSVISGGSVFVTSGTAVYRLTRSTSGWSATFLADLNGPTAGIVSSGSSLFAATFYDVRRSSDNGQIWNDVNSGLPGANITSIAANGTQLFVGTQKNGVFVSSNSGASWTSANTGITSIAVQGIVAAPGSAGGSYVYVGTDHGVFISSNNGTSWSASTAGLPTLDGMQVRYSNFAVKGTKIFAVADSIGIYLTTDNGTTWTEVSKTLPGSNVLAIATNGTSAYAGTAECGLYRTSDDGATWTKIQLESSERPTTNGCGISLNTVTGGGNTVFVGTDHGVYRTSDNGANWKFSSKGMFRVIYAEIGAGSLMKMPSAQVFAFTPASDGTGGSYIFVGTNIGGIFLSRDGGLTWSEVNKGFPYTPWDPMYIGGKQYPSVTALAASGTVLWAGMETGRVYQSTNYGSTWTATNTGIPETQVTSLAFLPSTGNPMQSDVFVGTKGGGIYVTTDNGTSWTAANKGLIDLSVTKIVVSGSKLIASTANGVFTSSDRGAHWASTSAMYTGYPGVDEVMDIAISGTYLFASTRGQDVFFSPDYGSTWTDVTASLPPHAGSIFMLTATGSDVWAAYVPIVFYNGQSVVGVERRPFSDIVPPGSILQTTLNQIDASGFPQVKARVTVSDSSKRPVAGLTSANFTVKEDGITEGPLAVVPTGSTGSPVAVMMAIDKGDAMSSGALVKAKTLASSFTDFFQPGDSAAVLPFDNQTVVSVPFTSNQGLLIEGLHAISGSKASSIYDALYASLQLLKSRTGNKAILLISAGIDQSSTHTESEVFKALESTGVPVYVVGFPAGTRGEETLVRIARMSNGAYFVEPGTDGLAAIYEEIASALKNQYQITYTSHNAAADGSTRTVAIATIYNGSSGSQQKQYSAPTISTASSIAPTAAGVVPVGQPFWVEVKVGDPNTVKDLYGVSFKLKSSLTSCTYIAGSAIAGSFLGTGPLTFFQSPDAQTISATVTKTAVPGVNGSGVVARFQFMTSASLTSTTSITFTLSDVQANTSTGASIPMFVGSAVIAASPSASIWPGDCDNNAIVNAADVLPIGLSYGQKNGTTATANNPGIQWQAYKRSFWLNDSLGKKVYADADGNGVVEGADVLAVGLNYSKSVVKVQSASLGKTVANQLMDGSLAIASVMRVSGKLISVPIALKTTKPVYGIAFTLSMSTSAKFVAVDTAGTVLGTSLLLAKGSDDFGTAEIGITSTNGTAFQGTGKLLTVMLDLEDNVSAPFTCDILNISANDARGNALNLAGTSYRGSATGNEQGSSVPTEFGLSQNYPNPFNPSTNFELRIASPGFVTLKVFDMLGRVVASLVHQECAPGIYVEHWDASALPSGVYYFRMTVTELSGSVFTQTRRLILVK